MYFFVHVLVLNILLTIRKPFANSSCLISFLFSISADYSFPPRELKLTDLSRSSIIGGQFKDGQFGDGQFGDGHEGEEDEGESNTMLSSFSSYGE